MEPGVTRRSGFDLAKQEWVDDGTLDCAEEGGPLIQGAQCLLIGVRVDGGDTSRYRASVDAFEQLTTRPEMDATSAQAAEVCSAARTSGSL